MTIEKQKKILFIPFLRFCIYFYWRKMYKEHSIKTSRAVKYCLIAFLSIFIMQKVIFEVYGLFTTPPIVELIVTVVCGYLGCFVLFLMMIKDQENYQKTFQK